MVKKHLFLVILFFMSVTIYGQQEKQLVSVSFTNEPIKTIIESIEKQTNYAFFYLEDWIKTEVKTINVKNTQLSKVLDVLFADSDLNYFLESDRIILTKNDLIYSKLPDNFFEKNATNNIIAKASDKAKPVFYKQEKKVGKRQLQTSKIGKRDVSNIKSSYTISGVVRDIISRRPLSDVALLIKNTDIGTSTNDKGYFKLEVPEGINIISIRGLGLEKLEQRIIVYNDGTFNVDIGESIEELGEVLIDADANRNTRAVISGITKIDVKGIKTIPLVLGERDVLKVAMTLPGISNAGEGAAGYNVRGGKEDQNLILLDDAVIYNPSHFFGLFTALNPFTTGNVEIYKGSIPAKYGGRLSSVFDITTKESNVKEVSGEASIGPVTSNLALEIPVVKDKSSILVGGRGAYSNWVLRALDDESLSKSEASFYDVVAKYQHKFDDKNKLRVTGYYSKDKFSITSDSLYKFSNRLMSAKWNHKINDKHKGSLLLTNSQYEFNIAYDANADTDFDLGYKLNETELKFDLKSNINKTMDLDYGISGKLYNINPGEKNPLGSGSIVRSIKIDEEKAFESAIYIANNITLSEDLSVYAGLRYSSYSFLGPATQKVYAEGVPKNSTTLIDSLSFGNNKKVKSYSGLEYRVSSRYFINPTLAIKAGFSSAYQYIHTLSNNTTVSPIDTWKLSDLNIRPQRANQYSLGIFQNLSDNLYELSLEGYYKTSKDVLDYKVGAKLLLNEDIETEVLQGEGKSYGVEFLLKKTKGKLNGWIGYTYSRSFLKLDSEFLEEKVNKGRYFPANYDKPHDLSVVANYKLTKRYSFSANVAYQTGRPVTIPIGKYNYKGTEQVLYTDRNDIRIPDYYRLDLSFNVEGNHKKKKLAHSFWNISVYNVLGRNNPYSIFFVSENSGKIQAKQSSIFAIPIPTITYNLKF